MNTQMFSLGDMRLGTKQKQFMLLLLVVDFSKNIKGTPVTSSYNHK